MQAASIYHLLNMYFRARMALRKTWTEGRNVGMAIYTLDALDGNILWSENCMKRQSDPAIFMTAKLAYTVSIFLEFTFMPLKDAHGFHRSSGSNAK